MLNGYVLIQYLSTFALRTSFYKSHSLTHTFMKHFYLLSMLKGFYLTFTLQWLHQVQLVVQYFAKEYLNMRTGLSEDQSTNLQLVDNPLYHRNEWYHPNFNFGAVQQARQPWVVADSTAWAVKTSAEVEPKWKLRWHWCWCLLYFVMS